MVSADVNGLHDINTIDFILNSDNVTLHNTYTICDDFTPLTINKHTHKPSR